MKINEIMNIIGTIITVLIASISMCIKNCKSSKKEIKNEN